MENELAGRYLVAQAMHGHEWWHYLHELWSKQFQYWLPFLPLGLLIGFWRKGQVRHLTALLLVSAACFFIVISIGHTRIVWYMAPVYPSLALLVGIGFERLVSGASQLLSASQAGRLALATVLVFGMFFSPYRQIIQAVYFEKHPKHDWHEVCYRDFMRRVEGVRNYTIVHQFYNSHVAFYAHVFNEKGCTIRHQAMQDFDNNKFEFGNGPLQFAEGDTVMICEEKVLNNLGKAYTYRSLNKWEGCHLLVISGKPQPPAIH